MIYDPFASVLQGETAVAPVAVPAIIAVSETGKLFGLDEGFVVGIAIGLLIFNFLAEATK